MRLFEIARHCGGKKDCGAELTHPYAFWPRKMGLASMTLHVFAWLIKHGQRIGSLARRPVRFRLERRRASSGRDLPPNVIAKTFKICTGSADGYG